MDPAASGLPRFLCREAAAVHAAEIRVR
eukprot:COSAG02_NODE_50736_length_318_cov_1.292237_1_plen_27_part_10